MIPSYYIFRCWLEVQMAIAKEKKGKVESRIITFIPTQEEAAILDALKIGLNVRSRIAILRKLIHAADHLIYLNQNQEKK